MVVSSSSVAVTSDFEAAWSKEFLDIQAITEYVFTLKRVRDKIRRYSVGIVFSFTRKEFYNSCFPVNI